MAKGTPLGAKCPPHERWRLNPIPPALKGRIQPGQEVIEVGSDDAHAVLEGNRPAGHDKRGGEHGPREIFDGDLDDEEGYAFAAIVGCVCVG